MGFFYGIESEIMCRYEIMKSCVSLKSCDDFIYEIICKFEILESMAVADGDGGGASKWWL